jgi:hypothetical protein
VDVRDVDHVIPSRNATPAVTAVSNDYDSRIRSTLADFPLTPDPRESTEEGDEGGDEPDDQREE